MGARITNNRIRHEKWAECALCGFEFPRSQMWKRDGRLVCREVCADENRLKDAEPIVADDQVKVVI